MHPKALGTSGWWPGKTEQVPGNTFGGLSKGKSGKGQNSQTKQITDVNKGVRHLLKANSHISGKLLLLLWHWCCACELGSSQTKYPEEGTSSRSQREPVSICPAQHCYLEPHPSAALARGEMDAKGMNLLSWLQRLQQVSKGSGPYPAQWEHFACSRFEFRLGFRHCRKAVKGRAVKQLQLNWVLHQWQGGRRSAQHSPCSPATLPLPPRALPQTEPGSWQSFPVGKCSAGTKDNPELLFRAQNDRRVISLVCLIEYTNLTCEE